jgi:hypothetical protein
VILSIRFLVILSISFLVQRYSVTFLAQSGTFFWRKLNYNSSCEMTDYPFDPIDQRKAVDFFDDESVFETTPACFKLSADNCRYETRVTNTPNCHADQNTPQQWEHTLRGLANSYTSNDFNIPTSVMRVKAMLASHGQLPEHLYPDQEYCTLVGTLDQTRSDVVAALAEKDFHAFAGHIKALFPDKFEQLPEYAVFNALAESGRNCLTEIQYLPLNRIRFTDTNVEESTRSIIIWCLLSTRKFSGKCIMELFRIEKEIHDRFGLKYHKVGALYWLAGRLNSNGFPEARSKAVQLSVISCFCRCRRMAEVCRLFTDTCRKMPQVLSLQFCGVFHDFISLWQDTLEGAAKKLHAKSPEQKLFREVEEEAVRLKRQAIELNAQTIDLKRELAAARNDLEVIRKRKKNHCLRCNAEIHGVPGPKIKAAGSNLAEQLLKEECSKLKQDLDDSNRDLDALRAQHAAVSSDADARIDRIAADHADVVAKLRADVDRLQLARTRDAAALTAANQEQVAEQQRAALSAEKKRSAAATAALKEEFKTEIERLRVQLRTARLETEDLRRGAARVAAARVAAACVAAACVAPTQPSVWTRKDQPPGSKEPEYMR